jgi:hypothetical protein
MYSSQPELNNNQTKISYKREDQHKKVKEKPNTLNKVNTVSTKLPLPVTTQLYKQRKVKLDIRNGS